MGFYGRWIVPRLIDLAMRNQKLQGYRQRVIGAAHGFALEVGVGSGRNLSLYGPGVGGVCAIDPSPELLGLARERVAEVAVPVWLVQASGERLPFAEASFDTIVMTWTLFVEHGLSPEPRVARWQHVLTPLWRRVSGGCHLDRNMDELVRAAGFRLDDVETGYMNGPKLMTFMYQGRANG
jgi:SAM-dependent methyltransferase